MIIAVGLGTGTTADLSAKALSLIKEAKNIATTASWHPIWQEVSNRNIQKWDKWSPSLRSSVLLEPKEDLVLAVAGDPFSDEAYLKKIAGLDIISAPSRLQTLPLPSKWYYSDDYKKLGETVVLRVYPGKWEELKLLLPQDKEVSYEDCLIKGQAKIGDLTITDGYILVKEELKQKPIEQLVNIMQRLRGEGGCPWDRIQTFSSLKPYVVEEAYELWDAIDSEDPYLMVEELGDVLLQVVFHCAIAEEKGLFNLDKVAENISKKMIHRHPHVFSDLKVDSPEKVLINWEKLKKSERGKEDRLSILDGIPKYLPGLTKALKVQKKAAKVGFDWDEIAPVWDKVYEECEELSKADSLAEKEEELGDLLFAIVNLARFLKVDPEVALTKTINKFQKRFRYIEVHANRPLEEMSLAEMDVFWEEAKKEDK